MKNIFKLFRRDLQNVGHSVIGLVVVVGLVIVPCLYAWFNIAGSWDPYGNTGNLKVAVANTDEGYKSDLVSVRVNIGESVVNSLRANDSFDWTFVDKDEAIEGVKSGEYYAAVVIPEDFSANMMTLFSTEVKHSSIEYYENQKLNAIAQIVTEKGSSAVQSQINKTFTETIDNISLSTASNLFDYMDSDEIANFVANLSSSLEDGIAELQNAGSSTSSLTSYMDSDEIANFVANLSSSLEDGIAELQNAGSSTSSLTSVLSSSASMLKSASGQLVQNNTTSADAKQLLSDAQNGLSSIEKALSGATSSINQSLAGVTNGYDAIDSAVNDVFTNATGEITLTVNQLNSIASELNDRASVIHGAATTVRGLETTFPDVASQLEAVATQIDAYANQFEQIAQGISNTASNLASGAQDLATAKQEVSDLISEVKNSTGSVKADYENNLKSQASELKSTVANIVSSSSRISSSLDGTIAKLSGASSSLANDLTGLNGMLNSTANTLVQAGNDLQELKDKLDTAVSENDLETIRTIIGQDPEALADALAAPVGVERKAIYPIKNYGSSMAPFYTILALWIGSIVLAAMMKVSVDEDLLAELMPYRLHQIYLGRYLLFALLALCQSTLVCAGDILFFGIQCIHPVQFILTGWIASLVFSNIIYTFTVSFGDIGKALAVVLLVMQVGGSGGTFPIEMTAPFFQAVYPFLPFTHGIAAMHAAMAGSYGAEVWMEMGTLLLYLIPSLALGLVFRRPIIRANNWIIEKLEETKLM